MLREAGLDVFTAGGLRRAGRLAAAWAIVLAAAATTVAKGPKPPADKAEPKAKYVRLTRDEKKQPVSLDVAIVRFTPTDGRRAGLSVDLVGAVHVGEKSYYDEINRQLQTYDAVLYELVAPEGTRIPKGGGNRGAHPVSAIQRMMQNMLKLEYQLDAVDYTGENMVHVDMSPEQVAESMMKRGESPWTIMLRMMGYAMARQNKAGGGGDAQLLMALLDPNRSMALKRAMAEQFEDMEGSLTAIEGVTGSTIIAERNKIAIEELGKQIAAGKRKLAIFYGAAHMGDFEKRLAEQFKLAPGQPRWLTAWRLQEEPAKGQ